VPQPAAMLPEPNVDMMLIFYSKINGGGADALKNQLGETRHARSGAWRMGARSADGGWADSGME